MGFADSYLQKHYLNPANINYVVDNEVFIIVVIPAINELELLNTIECLNNCKLTTCKVEVIIVVNSSETSDLEIINNNKIIFSNLCKWIDNEGSKHQRITYLPFLYENLPSKFAGAGLARKIGMDIAVSRFNQINKPEGVIVCFDADCSCSDNYLTEIENHFINNPKTTGCSIYFEHPLSGTKHDTVVYEAITLYELFLRYYKNGLKYAGFPYAYHTVGSSMAVRASVYAKQGGMNRKQAGEDFYFLQKIIPLGNFSELNSVVVSPSPRPSFRVPFGTGAYITKFLSGEDKELLTYNPDCYDVIKIIFTNYQLFFKTNKGTFNEKLQFFPDIISNFLILNDFEVELEKINQHSPNHKIFTDRFFQWFNAFRVLKFLNYAHEKYYEKVDIEQASVNLAIKLVYNINKNTEKQELLKLYREIDRK